MSLTLAALFGLTAALYASVGFGGGSTYNALLVLSGTDYRVLPAIALACNIIVVTGGTVRFIQAGELRLGALAPFLMASVPAAWIGGRIPVSETFFIGLLGITLLVSGVHLALQGLGQHTAPPNGHKPTPLHIALGAGAGIGLVSGLAGIGGGIFLAPLLYMLKWGQPRQIAAACSFFILVNSISGLTGQIMKLQATDFLSLAEPYLPLLLCVFAGGQLGSWLATKGLPAVLIKRLTAALILYVALRLLWRWGQAMGPVFG